MINKLNIRSLKSIDEINMNLSNFNLFLGTNSSGKSTVIQGILALSQNINQKECKLNGKLVSFGEFREARNFNTNAKSIFVEKVYRVC